ncbi:ATP-binding protein [Geodermatophilus sp. DSM 45219]|uniref:ATP-binding protein n=1 Tax=Geodermatophilus sp. DSM 45219 TaxID=1881103 RepID=UPI00088E9789|nr:ATP-binding protein [Geodermatophilus sp. DSM 45219]SDO07946.1 Histidine kinase-, DNA gyrase B-, and HSP90-like ATPase [Geodermatophilus sp. DSM 45219]
MTDLAGKPDGEQDPLKVEATADKALFVSMLVKDIELLPAVMDLVDNSVDGARATSPGAPEMHKIDLNVGVDKFSISDDCGGIPIDVARHYAFRFGRPKDYAGIAGSVGQFGIGMKRALFKLGTRFTVESRSRDSRFVLPVDVDAWLDDPSPDWQFRMSQIDEYYEPASGSGVGTVVTVDRLHESVAEDFGDPLILAQLREQIRMRHQSVLQQGLTITLNGQRLRGFAPQLLTGPDFKPINRSLFVPSGSDGVNARIVAGIVAGDDDLKDEGQAEDFTDPGQAGWWVFCNDRLLLIAERTFLTGWGDGTAAYHPQYRRFRGYVYLTSLDASLLPWNTTKTSVDQDSRVWRVVRGEMKKALAEVLSVINRLKSERQYGDDVDDMPVFKALSHSSSVPVNDLAQSDTLVAPQPSQASRRPRSRPTTQKIQYNVEIERFQAAAEVLNVGTAADVGRRTFDYFFDREVED